MKKQLLKLSLASIAVAAFTSGCVVSPDGRVGVMLPQVVFAPPVVVAAPPVVAVEAGPVAVFPETYVQVDGIGMVGEIGGVDYYMSDGVWIVCDPFRLERFHGWERDHRDWREHAVHNDRFRGHSDRNVRGGPVHDDRNVRGEPGRGGDKNIHSQPGRGQPGHSDPKHGKQPVKKAAPEKRDDKK